MVINYIPSVIHITESIPITSNNIDSSDNYTLLASKEKEIAALKRKINLLQRQNVVIV